MSIKSIIAVIVVSVLIGIGIFAYTGKSANTKATNTTAPREIPSTTETVATPTPLPSQPPIDKNTDLEAEISNQSSPDFSADYTKLKEEVNQSF